MRKRHSGWSRRGSAAVFAAVALVAAGCSGPATGSGGSARPRILDFALANDVTGLDPTNMASVEAILTVSHIVEPLYRTDAKGRIVPWLAQRGERSADGLTWRFDLRPGVRFSTGKPLTADDVVFSLNTVRKSANWSSMFAAVKAVRAESPSRVAVTTKKPYAPMLANLSLYAAGIMPKDFGGVSQKEFAQHPVGTGPFTLGAWTRGRQLTLERNPRYWQAGKPLLDRVVLRVVPDGNSRATQLRARQLDVAASPGWAQLPQMEKTPHVTVGKYGLGPVDFVLLNTHSRLFKDARLRQAVDLAVDRNAIVSVALSGAGRPGGSVLSPTLPGFDAGIAPAGRNVAAAKRLVSEATQASGVRPSFTLMLMSGDPYANKVGPMLQQNLTEAGFDVKLQPLDSIFEQAQAGKYDAMILAWSSDIVDPSELLSYYVAVKGLFTGADTSEVSRLLTRADAELDPARRAEILHEVQQKIHNTHNMITLDYQPYVYVFTADVKGFSLNPTGIPWLTDVTVGG